jgi:hypothetical protein
MYAVFASFEGHEIHSVEIITRRHTPKVPLAIVDSCMVGLFLKPFGINHANLKERRGFQETSGNKKEDLKNGRGFG